MENTKVMNTAPVEEAKERKVRPAYNGATVVTKLSSNIIDDGNALISADMPDKRQQAEIAQMKADIKAGNVCYGKIIAVEVAEGNTAVRMALKHGTLRVVIPAEDFFAHSAMKDIEQDSKEQKFTRYRRKGSHMLGAAVSFVPKAMGEDEEGVPFVVASRKESMDKLQDKHFFGPHADAKLGSMATASIISAGPRYVTVECMGVESVIGTGGLSAFEYIEDAAEKFRPGMGIVVAVEALDVDKEARVIKEISFSHSLVERCNAKVETASERMVNGRYMASVVAVIKGYYVVIITGLKIRGLIPLDACAGTDSLIIGDTVSMLVTGINKEKNMVIGRCMKVG